MFTVAPVVGALAYFEAALLCPIAITAARAIGASFVNLQTDPAQRKYAFYDTADGGLGLTT